MLDRRAAAGRGSAMGVGRPDSAKGLSNKSDFNDFTPARMNSGRGDFRFSGLVRQAPFFIRTAHRELSRTRNSQRVEKTC